MGISVHVSPIGELGRVLVCWGLTISSGGSHLSSWEPHGTHGEESIHWEL
jgi:hypothetical protein